MPEAYTHFRTAKNALKIANVQCENPNAYFVGAQGPDPFFMYKYLSKKHGATVRELGSQLHHEKCGEYLLALINLANTPTKRSYVMGALTHYATDTSLHGYVSFVTQKGQAYSMPGGHGYFEMALDSELYYEDFSKRVIPNNKSLPKIITKELAEVSTLIQKALQKEYACTKELEQIVDSFHSFNFFQHFFKSEYGIKRFLFGIIEIITFHKKGWLTSHCTNKRFKRNLPEVWRSPFTGAETDDNVNDLVYDAETKSAAFIKAATGYWQGELSFNKLSRIIGSVDYTSGLPCTAKNEACASN